MAFLNPLLLILATALGAYLRHNGMSSLARTAVLALAVVSGICVAVTGEYQVAALVAACGVMFFYGALAPVATRIDLKARPEYRFCPNCTHKLKLRVIEGKAKLACPRCSFVYWNNPIVVGVAVIPSEDGNSIILVKRGVAPKMGMWCLPGGFAEPNEHPTETAIRESGEEVTLDIIIDRLLAVHAAPGGNQVLVFYLAKPMSKQPAPGSDALEARYFRLDELPSDIAFSTHVQVIGAWKAAWLAAKQ